MSISSVNTLYLDQSKILSCCKELNIVDIVFLGTFDYVDFGGSFIHVHVIVMMHIILDMLSFILFPEYALNSELYVFISWKHEDFLMD